MTPALPWKWIGQTYAAIQTTSELTNEIKWIKGDQCNHYHCHLS